MDPEIFVWQDPDGVDRRLQQLGLRKAELWEALEKAQAQRRTCTLFDPITLHGNIFWGRLIRFLRETYVPQGWKWARPELIELLINPEVGFAITTCSGNQATGRHDQDPASKYPKGAATQKRVRANDPVIPGMEAYAPVPPEDQTYSGMPTWYLLYYDEAISDDEGEHTRIWAELSLPKQVGSHGRITGWIERIILDHRDFPEPWLAEADETPDAPTDINVPLERLS